MKKNIYKLLVFCWSFQVSYSQTVLNTDTTQNTYDLINSVLALPNKNVVEVPDCNLASFVYHITQVFDTNLNKDIFEFYIHVSPDNDCCQAFDKQRT